MSPSRGWAITFVGWVLFTLSAVFFTVAAARSGGLVELVASASFLAGCLVFIVAVVADRPRGG